MMMAGKLPNGKWLLPKRAEGDGLLGDGFVEVDEDHEEVALWRKWYANNDIPVPLCSEVNSDEPFVENHAEDAHGHEISPLNSPSPPPAAPGKSLSADDAYREARDFLTRKGQDDAKGHHHAPAGSPEGGQFTSTGQGGSGSVKKKPRAKDGAADKIGAMNIKGGEHLSAAQHKDLADLFAQAGIAPKKIAVLPDFHAEYMASVHNQTGHLDIARQGWDDNVRESQYGRMAKQWEQSRPAGFEDVPADLSTSFKGLLAHELGHYFETLHKAPLHYDKDPAVREAASRLSGHTYEAVQDLDAKPWWPKGHDAEREVFADFFEAYILGKPVPPILAEHFQKLGVKAGREAS